MDIISHSPLRTESLLWQIHPGRWTMTVVCKATFTLTPDRVTLADTQEDILERELHWDDDPRASLYAPSDLVPVKPRADVVLVGHAYAPNGWAVRSLVARLVVGGMEKAIEVFCQRTWTRDGKAQDGPRWTKMALRYERAGGGSDTWNPVGMSVPATPDGHGRIHAPHLQPPGSTVVGPPEVMRPICFGPIAAGWLLRRERLGSRADSWDESQIGSHALGEDFDLGYFQAAPADQQIDALPDDVPLLLENLLPSTPRLVTSLPGTRPRAFVEGASGAAPRDLPLMADTLWIDTDRALCTVTWRGLLPLERRDQAGRIFVALEERGAPVTWEKLAGPRKTTTGKSYTGLMPVREILETAAAAAQPAREATPASRPRPPVHEPTTLTIEARPGQGPVMPFGARQKASSGDPSAAPAVVTPPVAMMPPSPPAPPPSTAVAPPSRMSAPPEMMAPTPPERLSATMGGAMAPSPPRPGAAPMPTFLAGMSLPPIVETPPVLVELPPAVAEPEPKPRPTPEVKAVELIWFEPAYLQQIRQHPDWAPRLGEKKPPPARPPSPEPLRNEELARRVDLSAILTRGTAASLSDIDQAALESVNEGGGLNAPLVLVAGELAFPFDERELLKTVAGAAAPLAGLDKRLKELVERADEVLKTPLQGSAEIARDLLAQIGEAWAKASRVNAPRYLESQAERSLLELRRYQRRDLLKGSWIRALFTPDGASAALPTYLPAALANALPLFSKLRVRLIAEALPQQDQYETEQVALRAVALGRVVPPRARRS